MKGLLIIGIVFIFLILLVYFSLRKSKSSPSTTIFLINSSLKMSKGKIISQIAHAFSNIYRLNYSDWEKSSIVIYKASSKEMEDLAGRAHNSEIKYSKIHDAGRTQIASGSNTVLIIGPLRNTYLEWFTDLNKLL
ncbi:peptidyl-tRNA hydrolase [Vairimorpha necatrix]|uniref:peptidyl-tRNA hydrolase n=1 Tax=Vairimorpha necatrix TaxID=6039 RepID=A0AAX4JGJ0_9MICR